MRRTLKEYSEELGVPEDVLKQKLEEIRSKLFKEREKRVRPLRDEKILTDWNGLAVAGFSKAGVALGRKDLVETARKAADFLLERMFDKEGRLLHRFKDGEAEIPAFLEDYAYLIWGLTELYFATFELRYLEKARELAEFTLEHFWDEENLGFFQTPDYGEKVLVRKKEVYDGATPSGNSVMAFNLVRLSRIFSEPEFEKKARQTLLAFSEVIRSFSSAHTFSLIALDLLINGGFELVCASEKEEECRESLLDVQRNFLPEGVFLVNFPESMRPLNGETTYYLCRNFACGEPTKDLEKVKRELSVSE